MRTFTFVISSMLVTLPSCPLKKKEVADAASDAETAAPVADAAAVVVPPPAPSAKNTNDVARFPAETKIESEAAKIAAPSALARTMPKAGATVASLKAGTDVTKLASYQDAVLVTFSDPKDATSLLMGWVGPEAFTPVGINDAGVHDGGAHDAGVKVDAGAPITCPAGHEAVAVSGGRICARKCARDGECTPAGSKCLIAATPGGKAVRVCSGDLPR